VADVLSENDLALLTVDSKNVHTNYFDGLGRIVQGVAKQSSPGLHDIVQPTVYDEFGREQLKYLPFAAANDGEYKEAIIDPGTGMFTGIAGDFYALNSDNAIADDTRPY